MIEPTCRCYAYEAKGGLTAVHSPSCLLRAWSVDTLQAWRKTLGVLPATTVARPRQRQALLAWRGARTGRLGTSPFTETLNGTAVEWMEPVSDAQ